jgi:hypothetical protein
MNELDLVGDWSGWRLRGRYLVSPDGQRLTQERLRGPLWRDSGELRLAGFVSRRKAEANQHSRNRPKIKVVLIDLADYRVNGLTVS